MEEKKENLPLSFAADLKKDEYIRFFDLLSRFNGAERLKRGGCLLVSFMIFVTLVSWLRTDGIAVWRTTDFLLLAILLLANILYLAVGMPLLRRRQAANTFDRATESGQIFAGTVTVTETAITKQTPSGTLSLPFSDKLLYMETREMQVFVNTAGRAIVLPGRCLTAPDVQAVRRVAEDKIPQPLRRVRETVIPCRQERMEAFEVAPAAPTLFETQVNYREEELRTVAKELSRRAFFGMFPPYVLFAFLVAVIFGLTDSFLVSALVFWGMLALSLLLLVFSLRRRYAALLQDGRFSFTFSITEEAISVDGGQENGKVSLPWNRVAHAVEGATAVEFFNRRQYVYIPKRCIEDLEEFRGLVERCRRLKERNG